MTTSLPVRSRPRAWMAWSSGKDSLWALHVARRSCDLEVVGLLTTVTEDYARVSMHGVREALLQAQADALGLPLHRVLISASCSNEEYEAKMALALAAARDQGVTKVVFGDLYLEWIRSYREERLHDTGLAPVFPLWGAPTRALAEGMVVAGVRAVLTCVDPSKVGREFAGREFDADLLDALPPDADPCGENGEFHTFAYAGPGFSAPLPVRVGETVERGGFVFTDVLLTEP